MKLLSSYTGEVTSARFPNAEIEIVAAWRTAIRLGCNTIINVSNEKPSFTSNYSVTKFIRN